MSRRGTIEIDDFELYNGLEEINKSIQIDN